MSYYDVLGVSEDTSYEVIKEKYHEKIKRLHPDKNNGIVTKEFELVQNAWKVLKDDISRSKYKEIWRKEVSTVNLVPLDLDDMTYIEEEEMYTYKCRCSNEYTVTIDQLEEGVEVVYCNGCSLGVMLQYEVEQ